MLRICVPLFALWIGCSGAISSPVTACGGYPLIQAGSQEANKRPVKTPANWLEQAVVETGAAISFPAEPTFFEREIQPPGDQSPVPVKGYRLVMDEGGRLLSVKYYPVGSEITIGKLKTRGEVLAQSERNTLALVAAGVPVSGTSIVDADKERFREFQYRFNYRNKPDAEPTEWMAVTRYHIEGRQIFEMTVIQRLDLFDRLLADRFIDSFRPTAKTE